MTPEQIVHILSDLGASSGLAVLAVVSFLWSQRVADLTITMQKQMDKMNRSIDQLTTATTELALTLIAQAPVEARPALVQGLKTMLDKKGDNAE